MNNENIHLFSISGCNGKKGRKKGKVKLSMSLVGNMAVSENNHVAVNEQASGTGANIVGKKDQMVCAHADANMQKTMDSYLDKNKKRCGQHYASTEEYVKSHGGKRAINLINSLYMRRQQWM